MISYEPFWKTLEQSDENWYSLVTRHHLSPNTLHRMKEGYNISTQTINDLCRILNCRVEDIILYVPSNDDQPLFVPDNDSST